MHKLESADQLDDERGWRVRHRTVTVHIRPEDPVVYVGVDAGAGGPDSSYADLSSLWAGLCKVQNHRELHPDLDAVAWRGKDVLLTPTSAIATNSEEVWGEFYLTHLLRRRGARVQSVRLPAKDGRRRTWADTDGVNVEVVEPPVRPQDAAEAAKRASQLAKELAPARRTLPRRRSAPGREKATEFIRLHNVTRLTAEVVEMAKREGISRSSLRRSLTTYKHSLAFERGSASLGVEVDSIYLNPAQKSSGHVSRRRAS